MPHMTLEPDRGLLAVPAYFHPSAAPADWQTLVNAADYLRLVILNIDSGPGLAKEIMFSAVVQRLKLAGIPVMGYVDTGYGRCSRELVQRQIARYHAWYRVDGVFFDQVSADAEHLPQYRSLAAAARGMGARTVVFNHGVYPAYGYAKLADLLVTFEGKLREHENLKVPAWAYGLPAQRFCHLVYGTPRADTERTLQRASRFNAGAVYVTDLDGANPWRRLAGHFNRQTLAVGRCGPRRVS